ncbi:MAG: RHS repeat-associated core domain-containing protein, partial [Anaerolineales bacterium]|nr:RHS repeat-associated core domain-containing protein [Anaerolineales bacterium]
SLLSYGQGHASQGTAVDGSEARYLPYGGYRVEPTAELTDHGFTGHKMQSDVGLIYMRARYFVPGLGRFASADTIVPNPGNPQSFNRYSYTLGNPLRFIDPTGFFSEEEIIEYFDVETWEDVLSIFSEGGQLEGFGGWLRILKRAEMGDIVTFFNYKGHAPVAHVLFKAAFTEDNGRLLLSQIGSLGEITVGPILDGLTGGTMGEGYSLISTFSQNYYQTKADVIPGDFHMDLFLHSVDWPDMVLDGIGITCDSVSFGYGGRVVKEFARRMVLLPIAELVYALRKTDNDFSFGAMTTTIDIAGGIPYIGTIFDVYSIFDNIRSAGLNAYR